MGSAWLGTTSVYGPAFTAASEPLAVVAGDSDAVAAWSYKALAAAAALAAALLAGRLARRRAFAIALVGWNPILAVHLRGRRPQRCLGRRPDPGGAGARRRRGEPQSGGALWILAIAVKWVPALFLALRSLESRATGRRARRPRARRRRGGDRDRRHRALRRRLAARDLPARRQRGARDELRDPAPARAARAARRPRARRLRSRRSSVGLAVLARDAARGRARLGLAACLVLVTTPYLAVWYLAWAVPARCRRGGRRRDGCRARALCVPAAPDDSDLRPSAYRAAVLWRTTTPSSARTTCQRRSCRSARVRGGELLAGRVVEVARPRQVDRDPARLTEHREAEDAPPLGEMRAEGVGGADGDVAAARRARRAPPRGRAR